MELIDIGANLTKSNFNNIPAVLDEAYEYWVSDIIITGTSAKASEDALQIVKQYDGKVKLYSTAGCHPHDSKHYKQESGDRLRKLLTDPKVVAVGEMGLDYERMFSSKKDQHDAFRDQLLIAAETGKPVFLHERGGCADDFLDIIKDYKGKEVVHCFTGDAATVKRYLDRGFHIGITGWINDERRNQDLKKALPLIPPERLMIETDAPFLTPIEAIRDTGKKRNVPGNLVYVLKKIAGELGMDQDVLAKQVTANTKAFFQI